MKNKQWLGVLLLLLASFFWGSTFVAQSETGVGPFTYLAMRSWVAVLFLLPISVFFDMHKRKNSAVVSEKAEFKPLVKGGVLCGLVLFLASALQQIGIDNGTQAGKAGFITALYLLIVPALGLFMRKRVRPLLWVCIGLSLVGLFLLCMTGELTDFSMSALFSTDTLRNLSVEAGDIYVFGCALVFSFHILIVDKLSDKVDPVKLSLVQFFAVAVLATLAMFIFENPKMDEILSSWFSIVYAGVLSSGIAYTLQIFGQKYTQPALASMLMSLESSFAVLSAIVFSMVTTGTAQLPTGYEWIGIALMFTAIMLSQLPQKKNKLR